MPWQVFLLPMLVIYFSSYLCQIWLKAGELGLLGVNCPEEFGGIGADWLSSSIVVEEQSVLP